MKKIYEHPVIEMESFRLAQQITSCGALRINLTDSACVLGSPDATEEMKRLALAGCFLDGCLLPVTGMDMDDGYCVMTNVNVAFSS
ncbi:MAG: hypothetical protein IJA48_03930 [Oscillospiraceae bacterium]|nr:hypothetical protein [Oscillospiraceae bacterium]